MMLNVSADRDFSDVDGFGVALCQYSGEQNHIAIIFKQEDDESVQILHVGAHKSPLIDKPTEKYLWMDFGEEFDSIRKQVILASIQQIAEANTDTQIRYGLDHGVFCLDPETGRLNSDYDQSIGFTCATFVIEVFLSVGVKLIDWESWPPGQDADLAFQKKVLDYLECLHKSSPERVTLDYLKSQQNKLGKARFSPQEIAASTQTVAPSIKDEIRSLADEIHCDLTDYTVNLYSV